MQKNITVNESLMAIFNFVIVLIAIYLPTSVNKVIMGTDRLLFVWAVLDIILLVISVLNSISTKQLVLSMLFVNAYLLIVTFIASLQFPDARISLARIAPIITILYLFSIRIYIYPDFKFMRWLLHLISITAFIWNTLILLRVNSVIDFTYSWYNQYYDLNGYYQLVVNYKPVMSIGVHTYCSFFYFLFFILCLLTYEYTKKKIFLFYSMEYILFTLFLVSTTAIIYCFAMIGFLCYEFRKNLTLNRFIFFIGFFILGMIIVSKNFDSIYGRIYINMTNGGNSFVSRYSSNSVFNNNFDLIVSSLGIGYNIVDSLQLGYSDSGYVVYLTMGNIPLVVAIYYCLIKFINRNLFLRKKAFLLLILSFEVALPATFNYRFSYLIIFVICYLGSLCQEYEC